MTLVLFSSLSISNFIPRNYFSMIFLWLLIDIPQWRRKIGNFNNRSLFSTFTFFKHFPKIGLLKLLIKFLYCYMLIVSILLMRIYTVITFCKSVICIYNGYILYFYLLENYLCQVWLCKVHITLSGDIELNSGPK